jgi:hypothetical protein
MAEISNASHVRPDDGARGCHVSALLCFGALQSNPKSRACTILDSDPVYPVREEFEVQAQQSRQMA